MRRALKIILAIVILIAVVSTVRYCANPYNTQTVTYYEYEKTIRGEGFILRNETVVTNDISGIFEPYVNEGERVNRNAKIGTVMSGEPDEALILELSSVNQRIEDIERSATIAGIYQTDTIRISNAVRNDVEGLRDAVRSGNLARATEIKREIGYLRNRTAQINGSEPTQQLLSELYSRKEEIETAIGSVQKEVHSPISGVYSSVVDGLERYGSDEAMTSLLPQDLEGFNEVLKDYQQPTGDVCKISDNFIWYLAAEIDEEKAKDVVVGNSVYITVDTADYGEVKGTVYYLSEAVDGKCVMIVSSDLFVEGISSLRKVDYEVVLQRRSGLRIPSSALRIEDGKKGVYILIGKSKSFRYVNDNPYRSEDDEYYIVDTKYIPENSATEYVPLKEYDKVIINPEEVR